MFEALAVLYELSLKMNLFSRCCTITIALLNLLKRGKFSKAILMSKMIHKIGNRIEAAMLKI